MMMVFSGNRRLASSTSSMNLLKPVLWNAICPKASCLLFGVSDLSKAAHLCERRLGPVVTVGYAKFCIDQYELTVLPLDFPYLFRKDVPQLRSVQIEPRIAGDNDLFAIATQPLTRSSA